MSPRAINTSGRIERRSGGSSDVSAAEIEAVTCCFGSGNGSYGVCGAVAAYGETASDGGGAAFDEIDDAS